MVALVLVLAAVDGSDCVEKDGSTATGVVGVVVVVVVSVLEDLVLLAQPARANPARIKVNNIVFFIGGLSCDPTDPGSIDRFATQRRSFGLRGQRE